MAEHSHVNQGTSSGFVGSQSCTYSLETIMKLQKALENGIPLDIDSAGGCMDGTIGGELQGDEANPEDDNTAFHFAYLWIQRRVHSLREALLLAVAEVRTIAEWAEWYDHTQVAADNEAGSRAPILRSTIDQL